VGAGSGGRLEEVCGRVEPLGAASRKQVQLVEAAPWEKELGGKNSTTLGKKGANHVHMPLQR